MSQLELINMGEVARQEVDWLYYPYLPFGKISIVQGDPGEGKTLLMMAIIARLSRGEPLFSEAFGREPMTCIYQTAEDGLGDTIKPRLEDAGADCSRVFVVNEDKAALTFTDTRIEDAITATGAKLLILDPLQAYLGAQVDMHRANEVRPAFHTLAGIAQRTGCAIVLVGHMNKTKGQGGLYRGLGSIDIAGAARSILLVRREKDEPSVLHMAHIKSNLAPLGQTLSFKVADGQVSFLGASEITAEELLRGGESEGDQAPTKVMQAEEVFAELAARQEEVPSNEAFALFAQRGFKRKTVENAKQELGLKSVKRGSTWYFDLRPCAGRDRPSSHGVQGRKYAAGKCGAPAVFLHPTVAAETGSCALAQVLAADIPRARSPACPLQGHTTCETSVVCYTAWLARRGSS